MDLLRNRVHSVSKSMQGSRNQLRPTALSQQDSTPGVLVRHGVLLHSTSGQRLHCFLAAELVCIRFLDGLRWNPALPGVLRWP